MFVSFYNGIDRFALKEKESHAEDSPIFDENGYSIIGSGTDTYKTNDKYVLNWGNTLATLRWNHVFSSRLFANITAAVNRFGMKIGGEQTYKHTDYYDFHSSYNKSKIQDLTAAADQMDDFQGVIYANEPMCASSYVVGAVDAYGYLGARHRKYKTRNFSTMEPWRVLHAVAGLGIKKARAERQVGLHTR